LLFQWSINLNLIIKIIIIVASHCLNLRTSARNLTLENLKSIVARHCLNSWFINLKTDWLTWRFFRLAEPRLPLQRPLWCRGSRASRGPGWRSRTPAISSKFFWLKSSRWVARNGYLPILAKFMLYHRILHKNVLVRLGKVRWLICRLFGKCL